MTEYVSDELIEKSLQKTPWDLGNKLLYSLCSDNFSHDTDEKIIAKVWLIGRSYAAAIERGRNKEKSGDINDNFYTVTVVRTFKDSLLDKQLLNLSRISLNENKITEILKTHHYLTESINKITDQDKRSFCSKYLHFHLPNLYFLYDTRAVSAIRLFIKKIPIQMEKMIAQNSVDKEYGKFFCKCFLLQQEIYKKKGVLLSPRQLDNLLIDIANEKLRNK